LPGSAALNDDGRVHLLEREKELDQLARATAAAAAADGRAVLIEGPAGAGKTALLSAAIDRARTRGFEVVSARGGELEGDLPLGVVRQLFERRIRTASSRQRAEMLDGAAQLVAPVFAQAAGSRVDGGAVVHALYWLTTNLARDRPLVVAIDDCHWADPASVRYAAYLVRRLEGMPVLVLLCARTDEPAPDGTILSRLLTDPLIVRVQPSPLTDHAVARVLEGVVGRVPDVGFAAPCRRATGGIPFLVNELATELRSTGMPPTWEAGQFVVDVGPRTVGDAMMLKLARLHPAAAKLASAIAVLGEHADLPRVAQLGGVRPEESLGALDALITGGIVVAGQPLAFVHPILRSAIYNGMPPGERWRLHGRAAELLTSEGHDLGAVAAHLLATEPSGEQGVADVLREAAAQARARGAIESAVSFLARALREEPVRDIMAELLYELATAENMLRRVDCVGHFEEARHLFRDPARRGRCALHIANVLIWTGRADDAYAMLAAGVRDAAGADEQLSTKLKTAFVNHGVFDPNRISEVNSVLDDIRGASVRGHVPPETLLVLGMVDVMRGDRISSAVDMVERGLDNGRYLTERGPADDGLTAALVALAFADELERAEAVLEAMADDAQRRGLASAFLVTTGLRQCVLWRRGDVAGTEDALRRCLALAQEHELALPLVFVLYYGADALLERDGLDDIAALALTLELPPEQVRTVNAAWLAEVRARLLLARGDREAALAALAICEPIYTAVRFQPSVSPWRSLLARACLSDDRTRAMSLAEAELADAMRVGRPRAIGIALRTLGLIKGGTPGLQRLRESEAVLRGSTARLEHARALVDLGAALRRANARAEARGPLRTGLDIAVRCGATRLAARAQTELAASGARPRRLMLTGRDSLTPTELRIATMAAARMSNPQIAQALFVTTKTVENQLSRIYKKLAISSRTELPQALHHHDHRPVQITPAERARQPAGSPSQTIAAIPSPAGTRRRLPHNDRTDDAGGRT
jgi:DNA-binding CsgD family transcriptional regulator